MRGDIVHDLFTVFYIADAAKSRFCLNSMKLSWGIFFLLATSLPAQEPVSMPALRSVVEAEKSFAKTSVERGIRESFLQFFAEDSVVFTPAPTNGKKFYANYDDKGRQLNWQPIFATISNAGDLGFTTGPWEMKKSAADETPIAFGDFVSIWKKQRDKSWKVVVDLGVDHPEPSAPPGEVQLLPPNETLHGIDVDLERRALEKREKTLVDALAIDAGAAITDFADDAIHVYRENSFPAVGKDAAKLMLGSDHGKVTRKTSGGGVSTSGDFAYRYGSYSAERANVKEQGYFLVIWKLDLNREWKIIGDVQKKAPPEEK
jgi:ketosteroid isomerase-like protein